MGRSAVWLLALWCACAMACRDRDVLTASYATLEEAAAEGAIARDRLPDGLPPGTREIRIAYDDASHRRWGLFDFPAMEGEVLQRLLSREVPFEGLRCDPPRRIEWWPVQLRGHLDAERLVSTGLRAYEAGELIIAVHWQQGRAYYWTRDS